MIIWPASIDRIYQTTHSAKRFFPLILVRAINVGYRDIKPSSITYFFYNAACFYYHISLLKGNTFPKHRYFHSRQTKYMLHSDGRIVRIHPPTHMQTTEPRMSTLRILHPMSKGLQQLFARSRVQGPIFSRAAIYVCFTWFPVFYTK